MVPPRIDYFTLFLLYNQLISRNLINIYQYINIYIYIYIYIYTLQIHLITKEVKTRGQSLSTIITFIIHI